VSSPYLVSVELHTASPVTVKETMTFDDVPPGSGGHPNRRNRSHRSPPQEFMLSKRQAFWSAMNDCVA
jgi:hypothetical protein